MGYRKIEAKNDILPLVIEDYEEFTDRIINQISKCPGVSSVYQLGGWSQPGISDIDLIVVGDSNYTGRKNVSLSKRNLSTSDAERYMLMHVPFVIPDKLFPSLDLFFYCSDLRYKAGKKIELQGLNSQIKKVAELYKLVSVLLHTLPRFLSLENGTSLRSFLTFAYSLKHTFFIIKEFDSGFDLKEMPSYIQKITDLRKEVVRNASSYGNSIDIGEYVSEGVQIINLFINKLEDIILKECGIVYEDDLNFYFLKSKSLVYNFSAKAQGLNLAQKGGFLVVTVSPVFAALIIDPNIRKLNFSYQHKSIRGVVSYSINDEVEKGLMYLHDKVKSYSLDYKKLNLYKGMPFELNNPGMWIHTYPSFKSYLYQIKSSAQNAIVLRKFKNLF